MARILTIDDNTNTLDLMAYLLRASGHVVIPAANGEIGTALAAAAHPDLIILDIQLPGRTGYEVLAQLRAQHVDVPIIAVTAHAMAHDRDRVLAAGFDGYLSKPIDPTSFTRTLDDYLAPRLRGHAPRSQCLSHAPAMQREPVLTMSSRDGSNQ